MKRYIKILFLTALALHAASCDDMLDREPETTRTEASTFYVPNDFMLAVNYFYLWMPKLYDESVGVIQRDYQADIACEASSTISPVSDSSYGTSPTDSRYSNYFSRIRDINEVFANEWKIENKATINQYLAEAYFFRAYYSFLMFADYGPLTIVRGVLDTDSPELYAPRATRDEFADFIIGDLEQAISIGALPAESQLRGTANEGRITIGAAQALLARVCLFEGTWQKYHYGNTARCSALLAKAVTACEAVMGDGSYELFSDSRMGTESYRYMFTLESVAQTNPYNVTKSANREYIFRTRFSDNAEGNFKYVTGVEKACKAVASRKMAEMHLTAAGTAATFDYKTSYTSFLDGKDPRMAMNLRAPNSYIWCYSNGRADWTGGAADQARLKLWAAADLGFTNNKWVTERTVDVSSWGIDVPIIRLAEIFLTYAEAKCELDGTVSETDLDLSLNKVRDRVGMPRLTASTVPAGSTLLAEIRRERAVELYLEGRRLDDLRRWATAKTEMSADFEYLYVGAGSAFLSPRTDNGANQGMPAAESVSAAGFAIKQPASKRKFEEKHYLMPLPTDQIKLNKNLEQNPDWN